MHMRCRRAGPSRSTQRRSSSLHTRSGRSPSSSTRRATSTVARKSTSKRSTTSASPAASRSSSSEPEAGAVAKEYTKCCKPSDYSGWGGGVAIATIVGLAIALVTGAWVVLAPTAMADLVLFCEWWLYKRLVCLDGEKCVIGMLLTTEPVDKKGGFERFDTDFSINLVLAPHTIYADRHTIETDGISGGLIAEQPATHDIGLGFVGYTSKQWANYPDTPVLHCEFE